MRQIYVIAILLIYFHGYSQLYIKPYGNNDSYVYVETGLLFVEKDIDLKLNPSEEKKASIYLRDEGQLVQGKTNSKNTGSGLLSVFQEGNATNYTYNYWSSPVHSPAGNLFGETLFEPLGKLHSRKVIVTSGLNGSSNPLKISDQWIYKLSGENYSNWIYIGKNFDIEPGEGFTMKGISETNLSINIYGVFNNPGDQQRYDFRGIPNSGHYNLKLEKDQTRLVGNPYPSAMDLNKFLEENKSSTGIAYFWDSRPVSSHYLNEYEGGYGAYSPAGGNLGYVPAVFSKYDESGIQLYDTGETGNFYARRFAPIGQGFLVLGQNSGQLFFKNEFRVFEKENLETSEFKQEEMNPENINLIRFNIEFLNKYTRQLLLILRPDSTIDVDQAMDAENLTWMETDAGWNINNLNYLINVRPLDLKDKIPLHLNLQNPSEVIFKKITTSLSTPIYLFDSETNSYYDLTRENVNLSIDGGEFLTRFYITFSNGIIEEIPSIKDLPEQIFIYQNNPSSQLEISIPEDISIHKVLLFDSLGQKIFETTTSDYQSFYNFPTSYLSNGVYHVKIIGPGERVITKKVIIFN